MDSTSSADALGSLSSNWLYILVAVVAIVAGYFIYKRYYSVSYAAPVSAPAAAAPAAKKEAEVQEYESEDDKEA
jgi:cytochrome b subunit of formate dehydrogenase